MRIVVTGAGGFVGGHLCRRLLGEDHELTVTTRRIEAPWPEGVKVVETGEIGPDTDWSFVPEGAVVFHLAAHVHRMKADPDDAGHFRRVNVTATRKLAIEAARKGARIVYLSTVKVHGEGEARRPYRESDEPAPHDDYAKSKLAAEEVLRESGVQFVALRPPLVYGPRVGGNFLRLLDAVARERPLPIGAATGARSMIFVWNLVDAMERCMTGDLPSGRAYLVRDGEDMTAPDLARRLASSLGVRSRLLSIPRAIVAGAAATVGRKAAMGRLFDPLRVDDSAFRAEAAWRPPFTVDEGLAATAAWYREMRARRG
ncbi:MAG: NAD-dependent epimerase/dehydratase family protein [Thermoanaerobaculia bacterium]